MSDLVNREEPFLTTAPWFKLSKRNKPFLNDKINIYAHLGKHKTFVKGDYIFKVGDIPDGVHYIDSGTVELNIFSDNGSEKILLVAEEYYFLGDEILFHGQPVQYNAIAKTQVRTYMFDKHVFINILKNDFDIAYDIMYDMAVRVRVLANQLQDALFLSIFDRVVKNLYFCSTLQENQNFKISQNQLAAMIGVHRVSIANVISELKHRNIIETKYGKIIVKDIVNLKKLFFIGEQF